jgi:beta-mannosidase
LWCGNNEIEEGWRNWGWAKQYNYSVKDSLEIYGNFRNIFMVTMKETVKKFDPDVPYIPSSPKHGWGRAESLREGDSHYWGVWHGKEPFIVFNKKVGRFVSEYGFQAFPDMATIRKFTDPSDRLMGSAVINAHQKSPIGFERIDEYLLHDYKKPKNLEAYVHVSQVLQAEGIKTAIEAHRRTMPYCMGTLYWQLNDCWPVISWSSQDYYGRKKALGYWIKNEYAAMLVSPIVEDGRVKIYVVSDYLKPRKADLSIELIDFSGTVLWKKLIPTEIPANRSVVIFDTAYPAFTKNINTKQVFLITTLKDNDQVLSENTLYFAPPKDLDLQLPTIQRQITQIADGYKVELSTDQLAKNVYLKMPFKGELPENYFDLIPGRPKTLIYLTKTKFPDISNMVKITSLIDTY